MLAASLKQIFKKFLAMYPWRAPTWECKDPWTLRAVIVSF